MQYQGLSTEQRESERSKKKKEDEAVDRMSEGPVNDNVGLLFSFPLVIMFEGVIKRRKKKKKEEKRL